MKTKLKLHLLLLTLLSLSGFAHAQGTAVGYQGRLNDGGSPATGLYDFYFHVFDAAVGGDDVTNPLPQPHDAVQVTDGLFNVSLDFAPAIFTGAARWLEIHVRTNQVGFVTVLTPRTPLLRTPYAIFADKAGAVASGTVTADQLNSAGVPPAPGQFLSYDGGNFLWRDPAVLTGDVWSVLNNNAYYNAGKVGIGTDTPARKLTVRSPGYGIEHTDGTIRLGTYLDSTAGWLGTVSDHPLKFFVNDGVLPSVTLTTSGNVGIGTASPQAKLHVIGNILASGTITGSSDRNLKRDFTPVNSSEVLDKVAALPISTWSYIADDGVRHLGPMAQDFYSAFNVGMDDKHISMVDADGVALAAIQGLNQKLNEKVMEIGELKARLERLENLMNQKNGGVK